MSKTQTTGSSRSRNRELPLKHRRRVLGEQARPPHNEEESGMPEGDVAVEKYESVEDAMGFTVMQFTGTPDTRSRKVKMLRALTQSLGIVTQATVTAGVNRELHYYWMKNDPVYARAVQSTNEVSLDFAEQSLMKNVGKGNVIAQIFYLKTKGRKRGYIEQVKHSIGMDEENPFSLGAGGGSVQGMQKELPETALSDALRMVGEAG